MIAYSPMHSHWKGIMRKPLGQGGTHMYEPWRFTHCSLFSQRWDSLHSSISVDNIIFFKENYRIRGTLHDCEPCDTTMIERTKHRATAMQSALWLKFSNHRRHYLSSRDRSGIGNPLDTVHRSCSCIGIHPAGWCKHTPARKDSSNIRRFLERAKRR